MGNTTPSPSRTCFKATIAYDGTDFFGFQIQAQERTVQGTLETVLQTIARAPVRVTGAGRTDAGVHATGQVIAFQLPWRHTPADLQNALNANLPPDIVVQHVTIAPPNFHPRFDARRRQYRYTILNQPLPDVLRRRYTAHIAPPLQVERMQQASRLLLGTHDFAAFGRPPQGDNTVRTVTQAEWQARGSELTFTITANAFLYRMVRNVVGTLIQVGLGRLEVD
ncbi:MAG: tRNA pseudouridine(38-40) synthase TruA, partial [Caldilineae bacterium]